MCVLCLREHYEYDWKADILGDRSTSHFGSLHANLAWYFCPPQPSRAPAKGEIGTSVSGTASQWAEPSLCDENNGSVVVHICWRFLCLEAISVQLIIGSIAPLFSIGLFTTLWLVHNQWEVLIQFMDSIAKVFVGERYGIDISAQSFSIMPRWNTSEVPDAV